MTTSIQGGVNELSYIMQIEDLRDREHKFILWQEKWIVAVETTQLVIDRRYLTSEFEDELKYAMATKIAEELLEECITLRTHDNEITVSIVAFRSHG